MTPWSAFMASFTRVGGVIEAVPQNVKGNPSVNLFIEPNGTVNVTSTHEQLFNKEYCFGGAIFPQRSVPFQALQGCAHAIGTALYEQNVYGYVGVDFVTFYDESLQAQRLWAVDINLRLTNTACSFVLFNFLMGGQFNHRSGEYLITPPGSKNTKNTLSHTLNTTTDAINKGLTGEHPLTDEQWQEHELSLANSENVERRTYIVFDTIYHPNLSTMQYGSFFNLCRLKGVAFDLQERLGTAFMLIDSLTGGMLGIMSVGRTKNDCVKQMNTALSFIQQQVGAFSLRSEFDDEESNFSSFTKCVKKIVKEIEKEKKAFLKESKH